MNPSWTPLLALIATLLPLLWAKRWITRHLGELSMRWVGDSDVALILYFVLVLPGVMIHEASHWLMATLLGVRVSKLSLGPVRQGRSRKVSLGSVRVANVDPVRSSLIGLAPLLAGTALILLIGLLVLGIDELGQEMVVQGAEGILAWLERTLRVPDFWLWLYLIFSISNAMLPSESDIAAIRPVLLFLGAAAAVFLVINGLPSISEGTIRTLNTIASYLASAFGLTLAVDMVFMLVIWLLLWPARRLQRR